MYKEYFKRFPEKYEGVRNLKVRSNEIDQEVKARERERKDRVKKFQRLLDEERTQQ